MLIVLAALALLLGLAPGLLAAELLAAHERPFERRALGLALGLGSLVIAAYLSALAGLLLAAPVVLFAATIVLAILRRRYRAATLPAPPPLPGAAWLAAFAIPLAAAWSLAPVLLRPMPLGWDPAFHTAIVELIQRAGAVPTTWAPYEPGEKFNYPSGLHAAMALFGRLTGADAATLFGWTFAACGIVLLVLLFALATRFDGDRRTAALAVLLFGLTDGWGTLASHASWGGLSNLAGLVFMSAFVLAVQGGARGLLPAAVLAAAAAFVHHLSYVLLGFTVACLVALELLAERRLSAPGRTSLLAMTAATLTAGLLVLLRPAGRFDAGEAFRFDRERMLDLGRVVDVLGAPLLLLGLLGLALVLVHYASPERRLLPAWAFGLLLFWATWDLVYRAAVHWATGENYTAMTPSRGLTDAALPLALCGGVALHRLVAPLGRPEAGVLLVALVLAALGLGGETARLRNDPRRARAFAEARAFCGEVRRLTPPRTALFAPDAGEVANWLPWLCDRETGYFPDPGYATSDYREAKLRARTPAEFAARVTRDGPRPVAYATRGRWSGGRLLLERDGWRLYEVMP